MLIDFGDFLYCNKALPPSGYVEEWWGKDLQNAIFAKYGTDYRKTAEACKLSVEKLESFIVDPFLNKPTVKEAIVLSQNLAVPLSPNCTFFWTGLSTVQEVESLRNWLASSDVTVEDGVSLKSRGPPMTMSLSRFEKSLYTIESWTAK